MVMTEEQKIKEVMKQANCSFEQACEALGIDCPEGAMVTSLSQDGKTHTLEEILERGKLSAAAVLVDIVEDPRAENKDRIAAAKIILIGSGDLPQLGVSGYEERFAKFAALSEKYGNVIDVMDVDKESSSKEVNRLLAIPA